MESLLLNLALQFSLMSIALGILIYLRYPNRIHKKTIYIMAISFSVIAMCVNPTSYWDMYRHYESLDAIRISGIGFLDFIFDNKMKIGGADYQSLLAFNIIRYIVVVLGNNRFLPFIMTFVTYSIWCYITIDWAEKHQMLGNEIIMSMALSGVLMPFIFVNSGLRNTTAAAIVAVAIYNNIYKNHKIVELIVLFFAAFTIHYSVIYVIVVYVITRLCSIKVGSIALFIWTNIIPATAGLFIKSQYVFLRKMASSFVIYTEKRGFDNNFYLFGTYIVLSSLAISLALMMIKRASDDNFGMQKFVILMLINAAFNVGYTQITLRPLYTLGVMSTPVLYYMYGGEHFGNKNLQAMTVASILIGLAFVLRVSLPEYLVISYC